MPSVTCMLVASWGVHVRLSMAAPPMRQLVEIGQKAEMVPTTLAAWKMTTSYPR